MSLAARFAHTDVAALNGGLGSTESQTDVLVPSSSVLSRAGGLGLDLGVLEDVRLLLESALGLDCQLGRPNLISISTSINCIVSFGALHLEYLSFAETFKVMRGTGRQVCTDGDVGHCAPIFRTTFF